MDLGERASVPAFPWFHPCRNRLHSATPWAFRMSAVTGNSFGAQGTVSKLEAGGVWQAVGLALAHFLGGPDQVLPRGRSVARAC